MPIGNSSHTNPASESERPGPLGQRLALSNLCVARRIGTIWHSRADHHPMECNQLQWSTS